MKNEPMEWFPLYVHRFLNSRRLRRMDAQRIGIYTLLICEEWEGGPLPDDPATIAFMARCEPSDALAVLEECFELTPEGWICPELEEIRAEQVEKRNRFVEAGRLGGQAKARNRASDALPGKASEALATEENRREKSRSPPPYSPPPTAFGREFEIFWKAYPLKIGRITALEAYQARRRQAVPHENIMDGLARYLAWAKATNTRLKHPGTFVGPKGWWAEPWTITEADQVKREEPEQGFSEAKFKREYIPDMSPRPREPERVQVDVGDIP